MPPPERATSRRGLLSRGAALVSPVAPASAYPPGRFRGAPLLPPGGRHLVGRFSYGLTPALGRRVRAGGGAMAWFDQQLRPATVADTGADALLGWWPSLGRTPLDLWQRQTQEVEGGWEVMADYQRWLLVRRLTTNRQVQEVMSEFWMNHLNVPVNHDATFTHRFSYDQTVRRLALGRYVDLLNAAITHPAMGIYLDNAVSTRNRPNENLGRELLELHTIGRGDVAAPHYTERHVKDSARILTGYRVDIWRTWAATYEPNDHATGAVEVVGFRHANTAADGRAVTRAYLTYLARHPLTAQRIARKLVVKFVRDDPPPALVARLAAIYLRNDTAIAPVLRALVGSAEFKASVGAKVRDPGEDVVATYRALGARLIRPPAGNDEYAAAAILYQTATIGAVPCGWPRPDGQPIDSESWSSPARMLASMDIHWAMSGRWWPTKGITYRTPEQWLPQRAIRFDLLVDHLSQQLLGRPSTAVLLKACCEVADCRPAERITVEHALVKWHFPRLLSTLLDSPAHLTR